MRIVIRRAQTQIFLPEGEGGHGRQSPPIFFAGDSGSGSSVSWSDTALGDYYLAASTCDARAFAHEKFIDEKGCAEVKTTTRDAAILERNVANP
jgi:hypothetical protein